MGMPGGTQHTWQQQPGAEQWLPSLERIYDIWFVTVPSWSVSLSHVVRLIQCSCGMCDPDIWITLYISSI